MIRFEDLVEKVRAYSPDADVELLRRAYVFSAFEHRGQVRHSGEPYLIHPLNVADFLADMKLDVVAVAAGLLHDVVEDTLTAPERIAELFGPEIAHVVEGVTKIGAIPFSSSEERQAENFRKMLLAMVDDIRVVLVKLADRLHNMRTLQHLPEERRIKIAQETLDIYAPIANRLGMSKVKNELEDLSFRYLEAKAYEGLRAKVEAKRKMADAVIGDLTTTIRAKLEEAQIPVTHLDGRIGDHRDERYFQWMRQLLEVQQEVRDPEEFLQNLKIDLYPEEVYIFTPKGEVRSLPRGATAVDFAYSIHTDVGNQCSGARVNGKMVPLRTRLQNGDIVEIVTQSAHKPSRDWLTFAVSSRARSKIKHVLQGEERARSIELGRRLFDKEARRFDLNPKTVLESEELAKFAAEYGAQKPDELLAHIGYGKLSPRTVLQKSVPGGQLKERPADSAVVSGVKRVLLPGATSGKIKVRGTDS